MSDPAQTVRSSRGEPHETEAISGLTAFAGRFFTAPGIVGSPFPSAAGMVRRLLGAVRWDRIETFVEFGPGNGAFTRCALQHLGPGARLIAIDTEQPFIDHLRASISDRRLIAVTGSALDVQAVVRSHGAGRIDCVLSGLPFSSLSPDDRLAIVRRSAAMMDGEGIFLAYQVRRTIEAALHDAFQQVDRQRHWWNLPPCLLYRATGRRAVPE